MQHPNKKPPTLKYGTHQLTHIVYLEIDITKM